MFQIMIDNILKSSYNKTIMCAFGTMNNLILEEKIIFIDKVKNFDDANEN